MISANNMREDFISSYEGQEQNRLNNDCHYTAKSRAVARKITKLIATVKDMELNYFIKQDVIAKLVYSHNNVLVKKAGTKLILGK